jgi:hypothetical protein
VDVCVQQPGVWGGGVYIGVQGQFHHLRRHGSMKVDGQAATMWATDHAF